MALDLDPDVSKKITKYALLGYMVMFFISPVQPLLGSTMMGLAAIVPTMLGPNPLRVLGLMAFALAGYFFWPEFQESKKVPTRHRRARSPAIAGTDQGGGGRACAKGKAFMPAEGELALRTARDRDGCNRSAAWRRLSPASQVRPARRPQRARIAGT